MPKNGCITQLKTWGTAVSPTPGANLNKTHKICNINNNLQETEHGVLFFSQNSHDETNSTPCLSEENQQLGLADKGGLRKKAPPVQLSPSCGWHKGQPTAAQLREEIGQLRASGLSDEAIQKRMGKKYRKPYLKTYSAWRNKIKNEKRSSRKKPIEGLSNFLDYLAVVGFRPGTNFDLHRKDDANPEGYAPDNMAWLHRSQNRGKNRGNSESIAEYMKIMNCSRPTAYRVLKADPGRFLQVIGKADLETTAGLVKEDYRKAEEVWALFQARLESKFPRKGRPEYPLAKEKAALANTVKRFGYGTLMDSIPVMIEHWGGVTIEMQWSYGVDTLLGKPSLSNLLKYPEELINAAFAAQEKDLKEEELNRKKKLEEERHRARIVEEDRKEPLLQKQYHYLIEQCKAIPDYEGKRDLLLTLKQVRDELHQIWCRKRGFGGAIVQAKESDLLLRELSLRESNGCA